jgi:hypothetical protein
MHAFVSRAGPVVFVYYRLRKAMLPYQTALGVSKALAQNLPSIEHWNGCGVEGEKCFQASFGGQGSEGREIFVPESQAEPLKIYDSRFQHSTNIQCNL